MREPTLSPDGKSVALVTDAPKPATERCRAAVLRPRANRTVTCSLPESGSLGHQDPAWRPTASRCSTSENGRDGAKGAPQSTATTGHEEEGRPGADDAWLSLTRRSRPTGGSSPRRARRVRHGRRDPRCGRQRAAPRHQRRHVWAPVWSPAGDADRVPHISGPDRRPAGWPSSMAPGRPGPCPRHGRPHRGLRSRRGVASRLVHPARAAPGEPSRQRRRIRRPPPALRPAPTAGDRRTYLERLARAHRETGTVLCLGLDPDPAALPPAVRRSRGVGAVRGARPGGGAALRRGRQTEPRVLRGLRLGGARRPRTTPGDDPGRRAGPDRTPSAATSARRRPARPSRCSTASAPMRSP